MVSFRKIIHRTFLGVICIVIFCSLIIIIGDGVQTLVYGITLQHHVLGKNLSLPFPDSYERNLYKTNYKDRDSDLIYSQSLEEFAYTVNDHYYYSDDYNCKYWSFVWTLYWQAHRSENNWELEYITANNHVFVMVYNESQYCTMDQTEVRCFENG